LRRESAAPDPRRNRWTRPTSGPGHDANKSLPRPTYRAGEQRKPALSNSALFAVERPEAELSRQPRPQKTESARTQTRIADAGFLDDDRQPKKVQKRFNPKAVRQPSPVPDVRRRAKQRSDDDTFIEKVDPFAQSQIEKKHVFFDFSDCPRPFEQDFPPRAPDPPKGPFREPTDFSKTYRFPSEYLPSKSSSARVPTPKPLTAVKLEPSEKFAAIAPMDEFLQMESALKETESFENDRTILNFHRTLRIVKDQVRDPAENREVVHAVYRRDSANRRAGAS
jgi:hypothetical protein